MSEVYGICENKCLVEAEQFCEVSFFYKVTGTFSYYKEASSDEESTMTNSSFSVEDMGDTVIQASGCSHFILANNISCDDDGWVSTRIDFEQAMTILNIPIKKGYVYLGEKGLHLKYPLKKLNGSYPYADIEWCATIPECSAGQTVTWSESFMAEIRLTVPVNWRHLSNISGEGDLY